jgi:hypothetical protein
MKTNMETLHPCSWEKIIDYMKASMETLHPCSWEKIIDYMKASMETFPDDVKLLYNESSNKQLRCRLSTKFGKIITTSTEKSPMIK